MTNLVTTNRCFEILSICRANESNQGIVDNLELNPCLSFLKSLSDDVKDVIACN